MQHKPTNEQMTAAKAIADRVVCLMPGNPADKIEGVEYFGSTSLLNVPDDPSLSRDWFVQRAQEIFNVLNPVEGDTVHIMGQQQLAQAMSAMARDGGMNRVESVTPRKSVDQTQPDGSVKKVSVFEFAGFRSIYDF